MIYEDNDDMSTHDRNISRRLLVGGVRRSHCAPTVFGILGVPEILTGELERKEDSCGLCQQSNPKAAPSVVT